MKKRSGQEINIYIVFTVQRKQMVHNQAALSSVIVSYKKWRRNSENKSFRVSASRNEERKTRNTNQGFQAHSPGKSLEQKDVLC